MSQETEISWCHHTFNGWWGCTKVSSACIACYAESWARRFGVGWGNQAERRISSEAVWKAPLLWDAKARRDGVRRRVFAHSMSDVFEGRADRQARRRPPPRRRSPRRLSGVAMTQILAWNTDPIGACCVWPDCQDRRSATFRVVRPGKADERLDLCTRHNLYATQHPQKALRIWHELHATPQTKRSHVDEDLKRQVLQAIVDHHGRRRLQLHELGDHDDVDAATAALVREERIRRNALPMHGTGLADVFYLPVWGREELPAPPRQGPSPVVKPSPSVDRTVQVLETVTPEPESVPCGNPKCTAQARPGLLYCSRRCSSATAHLRYLARKNELPPPEQRPKRKPLRPRIIEVLAEAGSGGLSKSEIARRLGTTLGNIVTTCSALKQLDQLHYPKPGWAAFGPAPKALRRSA